MNNRRFWPSYSHNCLQLHQHQFDEVVQDRIGALNPMALRLEVVVSDAKVVKSSVLLM